MTSPMLQIEGDHHACNAFSARIKVLHLIKSSEFGGPQSYVLSIMRHLNTQVFAPTVVCPPKGPLLSDLEKLGVQIVTMPIERYGISPFDDLKAFFKLRRIIRRNKFHVVHSHSSKTGFMGRMAARLEEVPVNIFTAHGFSFYEAQHRQIYRLCVLYEQQMAKITDAIVTVSETLRQQANTYRISDNCETICIPNGISLDRFRRERDSGELLEQLGIPHGAPVAGTVGRLEKQKGHEILIKAAMSVKAEIPDIHFVFVGDGSLAENLKRQCSASLLGNVIHFVGNQREVEQYLPIFDVFVLPSLWEGLPIALLEAMAAGLPIVATDIPGNRELVVHGENGLLVPPSNPDKLACGIIQILSNSSLAKRMGSRGRDLVFENYDEVKMVRKIEEMYLRLLHSKNIDTRPACK